MNINFFQGSSQHLSQLQSVSGGFLFSSSCLPRSFARSSTKWLFFFFIFFACREPLVSLLRKSLDGFIGAHPNHSEKALESTQLYTKSGLSVLFSPLLLGNQFILKTHTQPRTTLPHQQPQVQNDQKLTLPPRCALV